MEEEIAEVVQTHGWYAANVNDHQPPFLYTIGLMQTVDHPEFIMFGLDVADAHALFSELVREIHRGRRFDVPGVQTTVIRSVEHRVGFRRVHPSQHPLYLGFAMGYCRHIGRAGGLEAMQSFWPDATGRFPFEASCDLEVHRLQPRLDLALSPSEIARWKRRWE